MEILRFEEESAPAPKKKHRSKGLIALGLVATMMGAGTALATTSSTISINGGNGLELGQGVTAVVGCDDNIGIAPHTALTFNPDTFTLDRITVGTGSGSDESRVSSACANKIFKLTIYSDGVPPTALSCDNIQLGDISNIAGSNKKCVLDTGVAAIYWQAASSGANTFDIATGIVLADHPIGHISLETVAAVPGGF